MPAWAGHRHSLGSSGIVDGSVRRIGRAYDDIGRVRTVTSYSDTAGNTPLYSPNRGLNDEQLEGIRTSVNRGRPLGPEPLGATDDQTFGP